MYEKPNKFLCHQINETSSNQVDLQFSVPQGSASGANLFVAYCESLFDIHLPPIILQGFADDHLVHDTFTSNSREDELNTKLRIEYEGNETKVEHRQNGIHNDRTSKTTLKMFYNEHYCWSR